MGGGLPARGLKRRGAGGIAPSCPGMTAWWPHHAETVRSGKAAPQGSRLSAFTGRVSVFCVRMTKNRGPEYSGPLGAF